MNNKNILLLGGFGVILYYLLNQSIQRQFAAYNAAQAQQLQSQQPAARSTQWVLWAKLVLDTFGNIQPLFQPGGIFYQQERDLEEFLDFTPGGDPNYNPSDDPYYVPGGWA